MICKLQYNSFIFLTLICIGIIIACAGCESILPEEYESKEFKDVPAIDQRAISMLADSSQYIYNMRPLSALVDSATRANSSDNQILVAQFSAIADSLPLMKRDTLVTMVFPSQQTNVYASLIIPPGQSGDTYFYKRGGESVSVQFVKSDTSLVNYSSAIPLVTVASALKAGTDETDYLISQRCVVPLPAGVYIVRFMMGSPNVATEAVKVVILSN